MLSKPPDISKENYQMCPLMNYFCSSYLFELKVCKRIEVIYQAWDAVFQHQMRHWEGSWKKDALRSIVDELPGVSSGHETLSQMRDINSQTKWF